jgi:hypothetical protein
MRTKCLARKIFVGKKIVYRRRWVHPQSSPARREENIQMGGTKIGGQK